MRLIVHQPAEVFFDGQIDSFVCRAPGGSFGVKPRHVDFATLLAPGVMTIRIGGSETFFAMDAGLLVKVGDEVKVAVARAAKGSLGELERLVDEMLEDERERERTSRTAVARMESDFVRRIVEFGRRV